MPPADNPPAAPPADLIQEHLARIWAPILEVPTCPRQSSFMDLGGDSISATQIVSRVRDAFGVGIPLDAMFEDMTIERMASLIQASFAAPPGGTALPAIQRQSRDRPLPLSHSQRRMWLVQSFAPDTTGYNVTFALRLEGPLDVAKLQEALRTIWARHDTFRTRFVVTPEGPAQEVMPLESLDMAIALIDLSATSCEERDSAAQQALREAASRPFTLTDSFPWRCVLLKLDDDVHVLAWIAHHILVDLWANLTVARELAQVYNHLTAGHPLRLPEVVLDCADHGTWQTSEAVQARLAPQLDYWLEQLKDLPPSNLPTDHPMADDWYRSAKRVVMPMPAGLRTRLLAQAAQSGHTPFMVLLACLSLMLGRQGRQDDVAVVTPIANRQHAHTEHIVASLTNTLVMRTRLDGDPTFLELLDRVKQTTLSAYANQDLPFDELVEKIGQHNRLHDLPLGLQVMLNVANAPTEGLVFEGLRAQRMLLDRGAPQYPLTLIIDLDLTRTLVLEYADGLFEHATAEAFGVHFLELLDRVLQAPAQRLSSFHWLSQESRAALDRWNDTARPLLSHSNVADCLHERSALHRDAVACSHGGQMLTYGQLEHRAQQLAHRLQAQGIGRGQRVGIHVSRGLHQLIALKAVLLTGAAYVPLDPRLPPERLQDMAGDAELALVLSQSWNDVALNGDGASLPVFDPSITDPLPPPGQPTAQGTQHDVASFAALRPAGPDDPAYIIYTSGSTGKPKGVVVPQRTVLNFLASMADEPGLHAHDRMLAVTTLSFDIAVLELLLPLMVGAQVVIASDDEVMDGFALQCLIHDEGITAMQATPATWRALLDTGWPGRAPFKALVGGEALSADLAARLQPLCSELWNMYGPTETTVWSTCWRVAHPEAGVFIGRPIANTRVRILDASGHQCPIGVPGEIVIEGEGVASGYWRRDELTARRFISDPDHAGRQRAYRTGDLGRWMWSGQLEHLGRLDHQIKIRGYRIEPGDIEAPLLRHPDVAHCVVIAREDHPGDVRLVAYVVLKQHGGEPLAPAAWREFLRRSLPDYMVPQHVVPLAEMPLLANGKLNRHALPAPAHAETASSTHDALAELMSPWEARLAAVWQQLLDVPHVRREDNFFDLGGHSLLAMQAIGLIAAQTSVHVSPRRYIFESLAQLAASYERASREPEVAGQETAAAAKPEGVLKRLWRAIKPGQSAEPQGSVE